MAPKAHPAKHPKPQAVNFPHLSGTFPFFVQLPPEIQEKIWEHDLPGSRNIEIYGRDSDNELIICPDTHSSLFRLKRVSTNTWKFVLKHYDEIPALYLGLRVLPLRSTVLINWKQDVIFPNGVEISKLFLWRLNSDVEMKLETIVFSLQHLQIHTETVIDDLLELNDDHSFTRDLLSRLHNLKKMILWVLVYDLETGIALPGSKVEFLRFRDKAFEPRGEEIVTKFRKIFKQLKDIEIVFADMKRRGEPPISRLLTNPIDLDIQ